MKIQHILEDDVVDLKAVRRKKAQTTMQDKLTRVAQSFSRRQDLEQISKEEFIHLNKMLGELKQKVRLFGFESIDDVFYFLVVDAHLPRWTPRGPSSRITPGQGGYEAHVGEVQSQQEKIRVWYKKLKSQDSKKFLTIVNNSERIRDTLNVVQKKLRVFQDRWTEIPKREKVSPPPLTVFDSSSFLDVETNRDLDTLQRVDDIATILQL
jgi:hypothetical protein